MECEQLYLQNKQRLLWLTQHQPEKVIDTLGWMLNTLPWVKPESAEPDNLDVLVEQRYLATWLDTQGVPMHTSETTSEKTIPIKGKSMSNSKKTEMKSLAFVEHHDLRNKITLNDKGIYEIPEDLHEAVVLAESGITIDQLRKMQRLDGELLAGVTLVTGEMAPEYFKKNPDATEVGFTYKIGTTMTASGIHSREGNPHHTTVHVETKYTNAEMNRVLSHLDSLFNDINT